MARNAEANIATHMLGDSAMPAPISVVEDDEDDRVVVVTAGPHDAFAAIYAWPLNKLIKSQVAWFTKNAVPSIEVQPLFGA